MPDPSIDIEIHRETLTDRYLMAPNALHRGEGEYKGLTGRARCLLAALLSFSDGWKTNRARIDAMLPELGERAMANVIRELRGRGYLHLKRVNAERGRYRWIWQVYMTARPPEPDTEQDDPEDVSAGGTMPTFCGDGDPEDVSAGRTMPTLRQDGQRQDGGRPPYKKDHGLEEPKIKKDQEDPPPPKVRTDVAPAVPIAAQEEEANQPDDQPSPTRRPSPGLRALVADVCALRPDWRPAAVASAAREAVAAGRLAADVSRALVLAAEDPKTLVPSRVLSDSWWSEHFRPVPASGAGQKRRPCPRHPGQPAEWCGCVGAVKGAADPEPAADPPLAREVAQALIRQATGSASARTRVDRTTRVDRPRPGARPSARVAASVPCPEPT